MKLELYMRIGAKKVKRPFLLFCLLLLCPHNNFGQNSDNDLAHYVQTGHSRWITSFATTRDGRFVVSGSDDGSARLWHIETGREMRKYEGHHQITDVAITPDDTFLLTAGYDNSINLWELDSGKSKRRFIGHNGYITSLDISADGGLVVSSGADFSVRLWSFDTGKQLMRFDGHNAEVTSVAFSPDATRIISGGRDKSIIVWNTHSGNPEGLLRGHDDAVTSLEIDSTGRYVASGDAGGTVKIWQLKSESEIFNLSHNGSAVTSVTFSPDDRYIAAGFADYSIILWEMDSGRELKKMQNISGNGIYTLHFSRDGRIIFAGRHGLFEVWDIETARILRSFEGGVESVFSVAIAPDGNTILTGGHYARMRTWNMKEAREETIFEGGKQLINNVTYLSDGHRTASGDNEGNLVIWDTADGKRLKTLQAHEMAVSGIAASPDGRNILSISWDKTAKLWDTATGDLVWIFKGHEEPAVAAAISSDGRYAVLGGYDQTVRVISVENGSEIIRFSEHHTAVTSIDVAPDGKTVASGDSSEIIVWNIETGQIVQRYNVPLAFFQSLRFSPNGKQLFSGGQDRIIRLWNIDKPLCEKVFRGHTDAVVDIDISQDGSFFASAADDGTIKVWIIGDNPVSFDSQTHTITFVASDRENDWIVFTQDGFWDSSQRGADFVSMVKGMNVWAIDQFAVKNNRPDIILERMGNSEQTLLDHFRKQYEKRLRQFKISEEALSEEPHVPETHITNQNRIDKTLRIDFVLSDALYNLVSYNIYVNNVPIYGAYGKEISGRSAALQEEIELSGGENKVEISCLNERGAESYRALTEATYSEKVSGDLYFLGFGISQYQNDSLNLHYAHKDVIDLEALFKQMQGYFRNVFTRTYYDQRVTVDAIRGAKSFLQNAGVDDTVVLFIAGHGLHDRDEAATYYYLTYHADIGNLTGTAANFDLIADLLQNIPPRKKLFLMDTCESGDIDESSEFEYARRSNESGIEARAIPRGMMVESRFRRSYLLKKDRYIYNDLLRRSGAIVFSSSEGTQFSYESETYKNGLFTEAVVEALTSREGDLNGNSVVEIYELRQYVRKRVHHISEGAQTPTVDRDNSFIRFGFPIIQNN